MRQMDRIRLDLMRGSWQTLMEHGMRDVPRFPLAVRLSLAEEHNIRPSSLAMALLALLRDAPRPTPAACELAEALAGCAREDGSFGDLPASALAARALGVFLEVAGGSAFREARCERFAPGVGARSRAALEGVVAALRDRLSEGPATGELVPADGPTIALLVWALSGVPGVSIGPALEDLREASAMLGLAHRAETRALMDQAERALASGDAPRAAA